MSTVFLAANNATYFASCSRRYYCIAIHVVNATALALNVSGFAAKSALQRDVYGPWIIPARFNARQFKSVTYSDVKVHLFDFPIRFADLTVNLSPASLFLSPPSPLGDFLLFPFKPFYYCSCQSCTFKVPITRAVPAKHPFPSYISTWRSLVVTASFTSASAVPKIDRREAGELWRNYTNMEEWRDCKNR